MKEKMAGREPGVWVLAYMQPAGQSPSACGRTQSICTSCTCLRNQQGPPLEQEVRSMQSVQVAVACLDYLCTSPQLLSPLLGESELSCVL